MNLTIKGLDAKLKFFESISAKLEEQVGMEIKAWAINTASRAVALAPADEGYLRNSIKADYANLRGTVVVGADYAAYLEFGTRRFAETYVSSLPDQWRQFASQFQGSAGGTFAELVARITEWVHRKGLGSGFGGTIGISGTYSIKTRKRTGNKAKQADQDKQVAYLIARKIVTQGIPAQPFLYPAVEASTPYLLENLKIITGAKYINLS